jgi:hypothetical protein
MEDIDNKTINEFNMSNDIFTIDEEENINEKIEIIVDKNIKYKLKINCQKDNVNIKFIF